MRCFMSSNYFRLLVTALTISAIQSSPAFAAAQCEKAAKITVLALGESRPYDDLLILKNGIMINHNGESISTYQQSAAGTRKLQGLKMPEGYEVKSITSLNTTDIIVIAEASASNGMFGSKAARENTNSSILIYSVATDGTLTFKDKADGPEGGIYNFPTVLTDGNFLVPLRIEGDLNNKKDRLVSYKKDKSGKFQLADKVKINRRGDNNGKLIADNDDGSMSVLSLDQNELYRSSKETVLEVVTDSIILETKQTSQWKKPAYLGDLIVAGVGSKGKAKRLGTVAIGHKNQESSETAERVMMDFTKLDSNTFAFADDRSFKLGISESYNRDTILKIVKHQGDKLSLQTIDISDSERFYGRYAGVHELNQNEFIFAIGNQITIVRKDGAKFKLAEDVKFKSAVHPYDYNFISLGKDRFIMTERSSVERIIRQTNTEFHLFDRVNGKFQLSGTAVLLTKHITDPVVVDNNTIVMQTVKYDPYKSPELILGEFGGPLGKEVEGSARIETIDVRSFCGKKQTL